MKPEIAWDVERVARQRRWCQDDAEVIVAAFVASGQDLLEFARRWRVRASRLQRWVERIQPLDRLTEGADDSPAVTFHPVILTSHSSSEQADTPTRSAQPDAHPPQPWVAEITRHAWTVRVPSRFDADELQRLLGVLQEVNP